MSVRWSGAWAAALLALAGAPPATADAPSGAAQLAFVHGQRVWTMKADGTGRRELALPSRSGGHPVSWYAPAWSPDGQSLAVARVVDRGERRDPLSRIEVMHADGTPRTALTPTSSAYQLGGSWSPDGTRLVLAEATRSGTQIVVVSLDRHVQQVIVSQKAAPSSASVTGPAWSPDGAWIAYTRSQLDQHGVEQPAIYLVRPDGTGGHLLQAQASSPAWSPDGRQIAFASIRDGNGTHSEGEDEDGVNGEIYVMDADGTDLRRLTDNAGNDDHPSWSSDGRRIVFASDRNDPGQFGGDNAELYAIAPDGSCLTWLTNGTPASDSPAWRPGSGASAAACGGAPAPQVDVDTRRAARVTGYPPLWLGPIHGNLLLSGFSSAAHGTFFDYDDCSSFDPAGCPAELQVLSDATCAFDRDGRLEEALGQASSVARERGALVVSYAGDAIDVFAGTGMTSVIGGDRDPMGAARLRAAVRALRRYGESAPRALPAPVLPGGFVRSISRAERAYRATHSVRRAAHRLHVSERRVRTRLRIARALARFAPLATKRC